MSAFKFFKKIIPPKIANEQEIQSFVNMIVGMITMDFTVEFVKGVAIAEMYNSIDMKEGWAKSSCMRGRDLNKFKLYSDNPDVCELGIIYNGKEIMGRFLRWKTNELGWVEDTLYYKTYSTQAWYEQRCKDEKLWRKVHSQKFTNEEKEHVKRITVPIVKPLRDYDDYTRPYLDTMTNGDGKTLHNGA